MSLAAQDANKKTTDTPSSGIPAAPEPQRSSKLPKPPKPRKVEKRQRGRKG